MLSDMVMIAMFSSLPPTIAAIAALIVSVKNHRKIQEVLIAADGLTLRLVASTRADALQEGHAIGVGEGKISGHVEGQASGFNMGLLAGASHGRAEGITQERRNRTQRNSRKDDPKE
jgi:hypothetical protein